MGCSFHAGSDTLPLGNRQNSKMSRRTKTLIAAIVIVFVWLPAYAVFIAGLQWRILPGAPWYVALLFYALAGTLWIVPIGLSLPWMYREPAKKQ
jgi:hypothetical protein